MLIKRKKLKINLLLMKVRLINLSDNSDNKMKD